VGVAPADPKQAILLPDGLRPFVAAAADGNEMAVLDVITMAKDAIA
jgi:hypothetical protein